MILDEAIDNFEREIVEFEGLKKIRAVTHEDYAKIERARQLAEWLKELQTYRNRECETCKYSEDGKCAGTEKCHECMWKNQYEQEPMREFTEEETKAYSNALDKMYKPTGFNVFDDASEDAVSREFMYKLGAKCIAARNENGELVAIASIENLPSVNPQPKTGYWEWVKYDHYPILGNWICSECKSVAMEGVRKDNKGGIPLYKYCPQCGAKNTIRKAESEVEDEIKEKLDEAEDSYWYFMKKNFGINESEDAE